MSDSFAAIRAHAEKHADKERATFSIAGVKALLDAVDDAARPTHRHVKRGSVYRVLGEAKAQVSTGTISDISMNGHRARVLREGDRLTVYRADDGSLWVRFSEEFADGRFEPLAAGSAI